MGFLMLTGHVLQILGDSAGGESLAHRPQRTAVRGRKGTDVRVL